MDAQRSWQSLRSSWRRRLVQLRSAFLRWPLWAKGGLVFGSALLIFNALGASSYLSYRGQLEASLEIPRSTELLALCDQALAQLHEARAQEQRYLAHRDGGGPKAYQGALVELNARLARLTPASGRVALYQPNGMTAGRGSLVDAVFAAAGLDNLGASLGIGRFGHLSLERLAMASPDVLVFSGLVPVPGSLAQALLRHPVVRHLTAKGRAIDLPARFWTCGGPFTVEAVERLAAAARG